MTVTTISLGLYLWRRIREVGTEAIFGVPGDFNLDFLDFISEVDGLHWAGNANELNAAYAADGYARVKDVPGCLVTTHGVGELSALNGIAGSAAEHVPVIHVVGQTPRLAQEKHLMVHHSIGFRPDHQLYNKISEHIRCAAAELWDPNSAPAEIDKAIRECIIQKQPAYIFFPLDLTYEQVPASLLDTKIDLTPPIIKENEEKAVNATIRELTKSKSTCFFVDYLVQRHAQNAAKKLIDSLEIPIFASHMAKGFVDEDHPRYVGLYNGSVSFPGIAEAIENSDLILALGWMFADTNTASFSRRLPVEKRIDVMDTHVIVRGKTFEGVYMDSFLTRLAAELGKLNLEPVPIPSIPTQAKYVDANGHTDGHEASKIKHKYIWRQIGKFLKPGDVLIGETGTASFGLPDATFPKDITYINQTYYGSIGYATACTVGADMALRELHDLDPSQPRRRTILVTGDGSMQLTVQEVGTMLMRGLQPIIMIINNNGYTIERAIHGAGASYNDIAPYNWRYMLSFFGGTEPIAQPGKRITIPNYRSASTVEEFRNACNEDALNNPTQLQVLEVHMDQLDIPWRLAKLLINRAGEGMITYYKNEGFTYEM